MTAQWNYLDLDLAIERAPGRSVAGGAGDGSGQHAAGGGEGAASAPEYVARVVSSPAGVATSPFSFPLSAAELEIFRLSVGPPRITARRLRPQTAPTYTAKSYGSKLNDALFAGPVAECFASSLKTAEQEGKGLRVRLRLSDAPALDPVPWEYLFATSLGRFVALSTQTPVVRYFETAASTRTLKINPPMRVLVMVSSPSDAPGLEVEKEVQLLEANTRDLVSAGLLELVFERNATVAQLQRHLSYDTFHVFHFIGHGAFDASVGEGVLLFENFDGTAQRVKGSYVGTLLHDARFMQLAVINACEGARTSGQDTWSGVGQSLVRQGLPAVVAMQAEISDRAALAFSHEFYYALTRGFPVDAAVSEGRKAIGGGEDDAEWGTPVLLQSATEQPFELLTQAAVPKAEDRWDSLYAAAERAIAAGSVATARPLLELLSRERPDDGAATMLLESMSLEETLHPDGADGAVDIDERTDQLTRRREDAGDARVDATGSTSAQAGSSGLPLVGDPGDPGGPGGPGGRGSSGSGGQLPGGGGDRVQEADDHRSGIGVKVLTGGVLLAVVAWLGYTFWPSPEDDDRGRQQTNQTLTITSGTQTGLGTATGNASTGTTSDTATVQPRTPTVVHVPFSARGQVVDGQVDDWDGMPSVRAANQIAPKPGGATPLAAEWWLAWNREALYVYTVVTDPVLTPVAGEPSQAFRGDSVSFEFGPDTEGLSTRAALRSNDVHLILGLRDLNGGVLAARNNSNGKVMAAGGTVDAQATSWQVDNGYAIEAAIPWSSLKISPPDPGERFGANLNASDAVASGSKKGALGVMVSSNAARVKQTIPALWDLLQLDGGSEAAPTAAAQ